MTPLPKRKPFIKESMRNDVYTGCLLRLLTAILNVSKQDRITLNDLKELNEKLYSFVEHLNSLVTAEEND